MKTSILILSVLLISLASVEAKAQRRATVKKEYKAKKVNKNRAVKKHRRVAHYHYRHLPKWGYHVKVAPAGAKVIIHKGIRYKYVNGVFYRPQVGKGYVVVAAPRGIRITVLPRGFRRMVIAGHAKPYYYYYGTFYSKRTKNGITTYVAIEAPAGAKVAVLPEGYKEMVMDGVVYYKLESNYYKEVITGDGEDDVQYELVNITELG